MAEVHMDMSDNLLPNNKVHQAYKMAEVHVDMWDSLLLTTRYIKLTKWQTYMWICQITYCLSITYTKVTINVSLWRGESDSIIRKNWTYFPIMPIMSRSWSSSLLNMELMKAWGLPLWLLGDDLSSLQLSPGGRQINQVSSPATDSHFMKLHTTEMYQCWFSMSHESVLIQHVAWISVRSRSVLK